MKQSNQSPKRKPGRPKLEQSETKIKILRVGSLLFMEVGYEKVSLELVAKRCNITKASVYYYYSNKATLFTECINFVLGLAYQGTVKIVSDSITLKEKLIAIALKQMNNAHLDFESMMRDASKELSEEQVQSIRDNENKLIQKLTDLFEDGIERGEISSEHKASMLAHLFSAIFNMKNHLALKAIPMETVVRETVNIFWSGAENPSYPS